MVAAILMLIVAKSKAQDFRLGVFEGHVSLRMDDTVDPILQETHYIHWYSHEEILEGEYEVEYDYESYFDPYQFEFLDKKEFKKFRKKEGPILIEFLDQNKEVIYSVELYSSRQKDKYTGRAIFVFDFIYKLNQGANAMAYQNTGNEYRSTSGFGF